VAQDCIVVEEDCQTLDGIGGSCADRRRGDHRSPVGPDPRPRALEDLYDQEGKLLVAANQEINEEVARLIEMSGLDEVKIRSALTCESKRECAPSVTVATWRAERWWRSARRWDHLRAVHRGTGRS